MNNGEEDKTINEVEASFRKVLNQHGYGFQYAVLKKIEEVFDTNKVWIFEVAEFPVATKKHPTKIDFIIRPRDNLFYIIAECKRVNPSFSNWCFVKAPYVARNKSFERLIIEHVQMKLSHNAYKTEFTEDAIHDYVINTNGESRREINNVYHIGLEVKKKRNNAKENNPIGRNAIEEAAGQVLKGTNGFVYALPKMFIRRTETSSNNRINVRLMPAIFTTANLYVSETKLSESELQTGKLKAESLDMKRVPWLYFQYPVSPALRDKSDSKAFKSLSDILYEEYMRTIAVISYDGIDDFFKEFRHYDV